MLNDGIPALFPTYVVISLLTFIPTLVVLGTAFTKISIVMILLRNALGVQQAPTGLVINSLAIVMTIFIMVPVGDEIIRKITSANANLETWDDAVALFDIVSSGFTGYLKKHVMETELAFFMDAAKAMWPESLHHTINIDNIFLLLPAHAVSEITRAFEIAFLLFLPFVVIDMIISNVLLALGAMMVPPMMISLPIKLLLFVAADGWARLIHSLIMSYV